MGGELNVYLSVPSWLQAEQGALRKELAEVQARCEEIEGSLSANLRRRAGELQEQLSTVDVGADE